MKKHLKAVLKHFDKYSTPWIIGVVLIVLIVISNMVIQPINRPAPQPKPQLDNSDATNSLKVHYKVSEIVNQNGLQIGVVQTNVLRKFEDLPVQKNVKYVLMTVRTINYGVQQQTWHYQLANWRIVKPQHAKIIAKSFKNLYGRSFATTASLVDSKYQDRVIVVQCPVNVNTVWFDFHNTQFSKLPVHFKISL